MSLFTGGLAAATALGGSGLGLWGKSKEASAAERGAELQAQATKEALDFTKEQKAKQEAAAAPYLALGGMASGRLPGYAAQGPVSGPPLPYSTQGRPPAPAQPMGQPMMNMGQPQPGLGALAQGAGQMAAGMASGPMVMVQAPSGETRQLPQALAQQAIAKGGRIVG